jgi:copper(I)-binding protein
MTAFRPLLLGLALAVALPAGPALAKRPAKVTRLTEVPVSVTDAWIREAPPGARAMAGYMLIVNLGTKELTLTGVSCPNFEEVQMHVTKVEDGMTKMKQVPGFSLTPGARLVFKPGGSHLMLMRPKKELKQGDIVPMVLEFDGGGRRSLQVKVLQKGITSDTLTVPVPRRSD